jgi:hypothetical protein
MEADKAQNWAVEPQEKKINELSGLMNRFIGYSRGGTTVNCNTVTLTRCNYEHCNTVKVTVTTPHKLKSSVLISSVVFCVLLVSSLPEVGSGRTV